MVDAVNVPLQAVAVNAPVLFASTRIMTGCTTRHEQGSGRFTLAKPGIYRVTFNGTLTAAAAGTAILNITQDGEAVAGAQIQQTVGTTPVSVSVSTLVRTYCCNSAVSVTNIGTASVNVANANFIVERLC